MTESDTEYWHSLAVRNALNVADADKRERDLREENERLRDGFYEPLEAMTKARNELAARLGVAETEIERWQDAAGLMHQANVLLLERLGIAWPPGEPFGAIVGAEIERLRAVAESAQSVLACLRGSAHRNDGAPIVDVCRVLLNTSQVNSLIQALEALGNDKAELV